MEHEDNGKKRLAILCGGQSAEHEVSLRSSMIVLKAIDRTEYDLTLICVDKQGRWTLCDEADYLINSQDPVRIALAPAKRYLAVVPGVGISQLLDTSTGKMLPSIDIAFSLLHGGAGEDGAVQGLLRVLNIPFVGSDVLGSAICMDKEMAKRVLRDAGISVTPWVTLHRNETTKPDFNAIVAELGLPLFVKPASLGSSVGVSKVMDFASFQKAVALAFSFDCKVLVESAIDAREIEIAVLGNDRTEVSLCGEVMLSDEFYTYNSKYDIDGSTAGLVLPAHIPESVTGEIQRRARQAFRVLECGVAARIDFFLSKDGQILINEINTLPGFTPSSAFPKLWAASGVNLVQLVQRMLLLASERAKKAGAIKTDR